ncbi:hypothetical protein [Hydrogenophaga sp.]|uniref:hypothetical protein n=1 Tax=Hydrogenophaga sp. TaxID=1904254 RepID=UPI0035B45644
MTTRDRHWIVLALVASLAMPVWAGSAKAREAAPREAARVKFLDSGSGETKAAREKRLRRECRGRPNAGACLGFTR